jgi:hypothetical protein
MMYTSALCRPLDNAPPPGRGVARTRVCVSACTSACAFVCRTRTFMYASCSGIFIDHGPPDPPRTRNLHPPSLTTYKHFVRTRTHTHIMRVFPSEYNTQRFEKGACYFVYLSIRKPAGSTRILETTNSL